MAKKKNAEKNVNFGDHQFFPEFPQAEYAEIPTYEEGVSYKFNDLPEIVKERLLKLQNEDGEHIKYEYKPTTSKIGNAVIAIIVSFFFIIYCSNGRIFNSYLLPFFLFPFVFLTIRYLVKHSEIKKSPIKPLYIITPTQFIETNYGSVRFWGLHNINKIYTKVLTSELSSLYIVINGLEEFLTEDYDYRRSFLTRPKNYLIDPIKLPHEKAGEVFDKLKLWCADYKKTIEEENFNSIIAQNVFYEIPNLSVKDVAKTPRIGSNLLTQIVFSLLLTLVVAVIVPGGMRWLINKSEESSKELRLNKEREQRLLNYDKAILEAKKKTNGRIDPQFIEYIIAMLENAKLNDNPKVNLLIEGENTISNTLEKRLQEKLGTEKLIKLPKNIAEGNFANYEDRNTFLGIDSIFKRAFKNKELVIQPLESRHKKVDLSKESMITCKYKLEIKDEIPTNNATVKTSLQNPQMVKVYYPDLNVSIEVTLDVPNKPQYVVNLNTQASKKIPPPNLLDGTVFYQAQLQQLFSVARTDFENRFGLLISKMGDFAIK